MKKQIEEMCEVLRENSNSCNICVWYVDGVCTGNCELNQEYQKCCETLYNAEYRKASDIAGKLTKELAEFLEDNKKQMLINGHGVWFINADDLSEFIAEIKEEYTEGGE